MTISFAVNRLLYNAAFSTLWLFLSYRKFTTPDKAQWLAYAALVLGTFNLLTFLYEVFQKYIYIQDHQIVVTNLPKVTVIINDIKEVKITKRDYVLVTPQQSVTILKSKINRTQLATVDDYFTGLQQNLS